MEFAILPKLVLDVLFGSEGVSLVWSSPGTRVEKRNTMSAGALSLTTWNQARKRRIPTYLYRVQHSGVTNRFKKAPEIAIKSTLITSLMSRYRYVVITLLGLITICIIERVVDRHRCGRNK